MRLTSRMMDRRTDRQTYRPTSGIKHNLLVTEA